MGNQCNNRKILIMGRNNGRFYFQIVFIITDFSGCYELSVHSLTLKALPQSYS